MTEDRAHVGLALVLALTPAAYAAAFILWLVLR